MFLGTEIDVEASSQTERKATDAKNDFEKCSKLVKMEVARFEEDRVKEFKFSLEKFLEGMIERQKEVRSRDCLVVCTIDAFIADCSLGRLPRAAVEEGTP